LKTGKEMQQQLQQIFNEKKNFSPYFQKEKSNILSELQSGRAPVLQKTATPKRKMGKVCKLKVHSDLYLVKFRRLPGLALRAYQK